MTPRFFTSFILVNIFRIPTNLFQTLIRFFRKTSAIATATLLGGLPTILFGDFAQLQPVGDSPMYSDKPSGYCTALHAKGCRVFESFKQSVTLNTRLVRILHK